MIKKYFVIVVVLFLFGCSIPAQPNVTESPVDNDLGFEVPKEWGKLVSNEQYKSAGSLYSDFSINNVRQLSFENNIDVFYQVGIDELYWVKTIDSGSCEIYKKYNLEPGHFQECAYPEKDRPENLKVEAYQSGFFDTKNQKISTMGKTTVYYKPGPLLFLNKNNQYDLFSPEGKYMLEDGYAYEGCAGYLVSVENLNIVGDPINCEPLLTFSSDEEVVAIQSAYFGMNSPMDDFLVVKGSETVSLLKNLLLNSNKTDWDYTFNIKELVKIDSIGNNTVIFTVNSRAKDWLKTGKFKFDFRNYDFAELLE